VSHITSNPTLETNKQNLVKKQLILALAIAYCDCPAVINEIKQHRIEKMVNIK
jgi:hypothetical protein